MMFYVYTLVIPLVIVLLGIWIKGVKLKEIPSLINILFQMIPHLFGYAFLIYFLEMEGYINAPWAFYTLIFFLIPVCFIIIVLKIFLTIKR